MSSRPCQRTSQVIFHWSRNSEILKRCGQCSLFTILWLSIVQSYKSHFFVLWKLCFIVWGWPATFMFISHLCCSEPIRSRWDWLLWDTRRWKRLTAGLLISHNPLRLPLCLFDSFINNLYPSLLTPCGLLYFVWKLCMYYRFLASLSIIHSTGSRERLRWFLRVTVPW